MAQAAFPPKKSFVTIANGGTVSGLFNVPERYNVMQVVVPTALDGTTDTWKLQALSAIDGTTWRDVHSVSQVGVTGAAALTAMSGFTVNKVLTFPYNLIGTGPLRCVSTAAVNADRTFEVSFDVG